MPNMKTLWPFLANISLASHHTTEMPRAKLPRRGSRESFHCLPAGDAAGEMWTVCSNAMMGVAAYTGMQMGRLQRALAAEGLVAQGEAEGAPAPIAGVAPSTSARVGGGSFGAPTTPVGSI